MASAPRSTRRASRRSCRRSTASSACSSAPTRRSTTPSAQRTDTARYAAFFHAMLDRGVALAPGAYEVMFPGLAHTDAVVDEVWPPPPTRPQRASPHDARRRDWLHAPRLSATLDAAREPTSTTPSATSVGDLLDRDAVARLFAGDHTLWRDDPTELADRLGWIPGGRRGAGRPPGPRQAMRRARRRDRARPRDGHGRLEPVPGGAGARRSCAAPGRPRLHVLDTTDPAAIARFGLECDPATHAPRGLVEVRLHHRDPQPPRVGVGAAPRAAAGSR